MDKKIDELKDVWIESYMIRKREGQKPERQIDRKTAIGIKRGKKIDKK